MSFMFSNKVFNFLEEGIFFRDRLILLPIAIWICIFDRKKYLIGIVSSHRSSLVLMYVSFANNKKQRINLSRYMLFESASVLEDETCIFKNVLVPTKVHSLSSTRLSFHQPTLLWRQFLIIKTIKYYFTIISQKWLFMHLYLYFY